MTASLVKFRIVATSDLHMQIDDFDYFNNQRLNSKGLLSAAPTIAAARSEVQNTILVDNGDLLQGNPMGDVEAERGVQDGVHPMIAVMNQLGYDAMTPGNHDFNFGMDFLRSVTGQADFPTVLANVSCITTGKPPFAPYVILNQTVTDDTGQNHDIRIGITGFAPREIMQWDRAALTGRVTAQGIVESARTVLPRMRADGADIVIVLAHTGIALRPGTENEAGPLSALGGIDALVTGHLHKCFPDPDYAEIDGCDVKAGTLNRIPTVMPGWQGSHIGIIDLDLSKENGVWSVAQGRAHLRAVIPTSTVPLPNVVQQARTRTLAYTGRVIGHTKTAWHSYLAAVGRDSSTLLVNMAKHWHTKRSLAGSPYEDMPILSVAAPYKYGGRNGSNYFTYVPAGELKFGHIADIYPFPNALHLLDVTGATLKTWLEWSSLLFQTIRAGTQDTELVDTNFPGFFQDTFWGVTYQIDLSQPPSVDASGNPTGEGTGRILDLCYLGKPVRDTDRFVVATNSYRAGSAAFLSGCPEISEAEAGQKPVRDILLDYVKAHCPLPDVPPSSWSFVPMPGTTVTFDTSADAADLIADHDDLSVIDAAPGKPLRLRLSL